MAREKLTPKQMQEEMERNMEKKLQEVKDNEQEQNERQNAVMHLSRVPGACPVGKCKEVIFPCNMMMHMLHKHQNSVGSINSEIYDHKPLVMCFDPTGYKYGVNHCIATLMYGGVMNKPLTQPALTYLCYPNSALIKDHHRYANYLPIMLMACRTTWYAQLRDKQLERQLSAINADRAGIYVFWLVAPITTRKLYYTLTVYDRYYLNSRSVLRMIRNYASYQNPSEFLPNEDNYLLLRDSEVNEFMSFSKTNPNSDEKPIKLGVPMELIIYENPREPPLRHCSQKELQDALQQVHEIYINESMPRIKRSIKRITSLGQKSQSNASSSANISRSSIFFN